MENAWNQIIHKKFKDWFLQWIQINNNIEGLLRLIVRNKRNI